MKQILKLAATASLIAIASAVSATTVTFNYLNGATSLATGSFSFADGASGVLGYGDLTAFSVTLRSVTYTLADVQSLTDYVHFGYDTAAVAFTGGDAGCGFAGCGYSSSLSAVNSIGTFGFYFDEVPGESLEYTTYVIDTFDSVVFDVQTVPEPASWAMMLTGFGLAGAALRRRRVLAAS